MYLQPKRIQALLPLSERLIEVFESSRGINLDALEESVKEVCAQETDRLIVAGLVKLLRDRCEFEKAPEADPVTLRDELFQFASESRRGLGIRDAFDRQKVLEAYASTRGIPSNHLESMLFSDLPGAQILLSLRPISAIELLQRYNLALAQGVLLRATKVAIDLEPTSAPRFRQLFRAMKFRRLMHHVVGDSKQGYRITLDGPMSLFESTQRYGLQLALFLPVVVAMDGWSLEAELRWGKDRSHAVFELSDQDGLVSHYRKDPGELEEVEALVQTFSRLTCSWKVRRSTRVFQVKGRGVFVPDLVFENEETKAKVYFEAFGYWSRDAVFERVEMLEEGFSDRFILAVSKKLRVSSEVAPPQSQGRIVVYANTISANSVLRLLEEPG
jgi:predicted nuclease of restriction endonuclease-like RecB superfamily